MQKLQPSLQDRSPKDNKTKISTPFLNRNSNKNQKNAAKTMTKLIVLNNTMTT